MVNMKLIIKILFALLFVLTMGCDKDKFADLNSNPSTLSEPDLRYSVAKAIEQMYSESYLNWFYNNFQYIYPWVQVTTTQGGNDANFNEMGPAGGQGIYGGLFPQTMDVRYRIEAMSDEEKATHQALKAITYAMQIQPAITNTDNTGSLVYTEAGMAPYTTPPLITPVLDNQETLFDTWLTELDDALVILANTDGQFSMGDEDIIYEGDYAKWAKFCNLLKLKIAARLVNVDKDKALAIALEVAKSSVGYMDNLSDDFIYSRGLKYYGAGLEMWIGYASKNLVDFMRDNLDPRLRFIFIKNSFNAEIVQTFIEKGKDLPPYVADYINYDSDGNFASWKAPGEPWVRYQGAPLSPDATMDPDNDIYFNQSVLYKITIGDAQKSYSGTSLFSEKLIRTAYDYTYPTKPGGRVLELKDNDPPLDVILGSSAETNLYLAEFAMLGATLPKTAQEYFNQGVKFSVQRMDALAKNNEFPYYNGDPVYENEAEAEAGATMLRDGEIDALLLNPAYDLSSDGLEKVYIQQYINFMATPGDIWALVRRSGIPKKGSSYLPWEEFKVSGSEIPIPRRFEVGTPTEDDINYDNEISAMKDQGFTTGVSTPSVLNAEKLWFDKQDPKYGEGPKE